MNKKGFSLVEITVTVLAIIAVALIIGALVHGAYKTNRIKPAEKTTGK